ncbi:methyltransferase domain-containing protein [Candidatus Kirkpatrickella diaphorinae]|uniref:Methyltransferase domain-containing protein n=1 Tax=Candidatus Kirkpatrickella diaphorinae TaxID=2984322 RepID=A0ABY6GKI6_9PROT|nr:methyltransferase domain-containing protein [Candidatus Kirkpatrickella diaphorinae]UYH52052.1 methyltransferase domain-containing protein [Candidatus Kirkpatrickella diaphorinae]
MVKPELSSEMTGDVTHDTLHHGRVTYTQFVNGYRTGLEPVLLAALVPARPGESILEAGCGAGAGLLCLNARVTGLHLTGIEADADTVALARFNLDRNHVSGYTLFQAEIPDMPRSLRQTCRNANGRFHHAFANPPWHPSGATPTSHPRRRRALFCDRNGWSCWITALAAWVMPGGTLSLALPAAAVCEAMRCLHEAEFGSITLFPLWPKAGRRAKIVLLQAVLGGRAGTAISPGLIIHEENGQYTAETRHVLCDGAALIP